MKKIVFLFFMAFCSQSISAQTAGMEVQAGDEFLIGKPSSATYKYVKLPRANTILKRGGRVNFKALQGSEVIVSSVKKKKDGSIMIKIKRLDGGRFFSSHNHLAVHFNTALKTGELLVE